MKVYIHTTISGLGLGLGLGICNGSVGCFAVVWLWLYMVIYIYILDWVIVPMTYTVIGIFRIGFGPIVSSSLWEVVNEL